MVPVSFNWRQLISYCFIKEKEIGSSLVLPEEDEEHIKNCPLIKQVLRARFFHNSMNSLEILDTAQKRRIYARNNHSYITIRLTQLLALYLTRSEQCRLPSTRTNPSHKLTDPSGPLWFAFRKSEKIIPDEIVNRFVKFITQQLNGILSGKPFLWQ